MNSAERTLLPGLAEKVTAFDRRLEWEVVLARPPTGTGDLRITANVKAAGAPQRLRRGWRWPVGHGRFVRMGELVVKDARGRELYRGLPTAAAHKVELTVPGSALDRAAYPVAIDPVISPEYPITDPVPGRGVGGNQSRPSVAFNGTNYLAVWGDPRSGNTAEADIYGTRVTPAGVVLDPAGIAISTASGYQFTPSVSSDGTNYLVAWSDGRSGGTDVYAARVSPAGTVLEPAGIPISTTASSGFPRIAFDGTNYLVVWQDSRSGTSSDIYGARVSLQAGACKTTTRGSSSGRRLTPGPPSVASDGTNYLVAWQDARGATLDIYGARVSQAGVVQEPAGILISGATNDQQAPSVAYGGTNYLVAWQDARGATDDIYGARVN